MSGGNCPGACWLACCSVCPGRTSTCSETIDRFESSHAAMARNTLTLWNETDVKMKCPAEEND